MNYYQLSPEKVACKLKVDFKQGLSFKEAQRRLLKFGLNKLPKPPKKSKVLKFLDKFQSPLVYVLLIAAFITALLKNFIDTGVILIVVVFNAILAYFQEEKSERAVEALLKMMAPKAKVLRSGYEVLVEAKEITPGDILILEEGTRIAADARVFESFELKTDESALTGESRPVHKHIEVLKREKPIAERSNMVFSGTIAVSGKGKAIVTAAGKRTEFGRITQLVEETLKLGSPLEQKIKIFSKWLAIFILGICGLIFLVGILSGKNLGEMFILSVALAVSAIPEGLPVVVTVVLILGVLKMAKNRAIVRRLPAVETLGSTQIICTDKTGTLTKNEMTIKEIYTDRLIKVTGVGYKPKGEFLVGSQKINPQADDHLFLLFKAGLLCNNAKLVFNRDHEILGDPTEGALVVVAEKAGLQAKQFHLDNPLLYEIPFSGKKKYMATLHKEAGDNFIYLKGAPEVILEKCFYRQKGSKIEKLSPKVKKEFLIQAEKMAEQALRVLGVCYRKTNLEKISEADLDKLVFLGLFGMIDPLREEAKEAVGFCHKSGIRIIMITGDHLSTAKAIAKEIAILSSDREAVAGMELGSWSKEEFDKKIEEISVYARTSPEDKLKIVKKLQEKGMVVAVTGDGVNDAPALKRANIGISMGLTGTDVAREVSDLTLSDDNFATIVKAVEGGRTIFENIRKVILFLLSTNLGEVLTILSLIILRWPLAILPTQILWINLVTDGVSIFPLGFEKKEEEFLKRSPYEVVEPVLSSLMKTRIFIVSILMALGTLFLFSLYWQNDSFEKARTIAFTTLVVFQWFNIFNCRSFTKSVFSKHFFLNKYVFWGISVGIVLQCLVIYIPILQIAFRTVPLSLVDWSRILLVSFSVILVVELDKFFRKKLKYKLAKG